jgi:uncharacterized protein (AIM24 family)
MKKQKTIIAICLFVLGAFQIRSQTQTISTGIFGQNAWWTDRNNYTSLDNAWPSIRASGVQYVRLGGIEFNFRPLYTFNSSLSITGATALTHIINALRANGIEPMVQVGFNTVCATYSGDPLNPFRGYTTDDQATIAANLVSYLNNPSTGIYKTNPIKYWIISNEPNLGQNCNTQWGPSGGFGYNNAYQIAPYIKTFASKMKMSDPNIKIIGPEWTGWNSTALGQLTDPSPTNGNDITGKDENGHYYIDVFSIHSYPFSGDQTRESIITKLTEPGGLKEHLTTLSGWLDAANQAHNRYADGKELTLALDEANLSWKQANTDAANLGSGSFICGQFWAEMMGICMQQGLQFLNFWSIKEGCNEGTTNIGYWDGCTGAYRPSYYHFQLVATNFSGVYYDPSYVSSYLNTVKTYASKDDNTGQISVLLMNQHSTNSYSYTIGFNGGTSNDISFQMGSGIAAYTSTANIAPKSTVVLTFNLSGNILNKCVYADGDAAPTCTPSGCNPPDQAGAISGTNTVDPGQTGVSYSVAPIQGAATTNGYVWTLPNGASIASGGGTNAITVNFASYATSGNITVKATNGSCFGGASSLSVTVSCSAPAPLTASSNGYVCQGQTINLYASSASNYSWVGPDGWTSNAQNPTRTGAAVTMAGTYTLTTSNGNCTSSPATTYVDVANFASIGAGNSTTFCSGNNVVLYAATGTGYTWQWIKDGVNITNETANNYTATATGDYQVKITKNGTCDSWSAPTHVNVNSSLVATATPGGPTSFCEGGSVILYANRCSGYAYQWQKKDANGVYQIMPGETNQTYSASTSGWYQIRVCSGSSCQWSSPVQIIVSDAPDAAGSISGPTNVLPGQNGVSYSVPLINGANSYVWTIPSGATIVSGANTNNITVNFGSASSGNITVAGSNGVCTGSSSSLFVTVNCNPPATPTISSNGTVCQSQTITFSCTPAANYSWVGPDGWTSNVQNPTRTGASVAMSGTYSLTTTSGGCTSAVARTTVIVENFATVQPGSSTTFCAGSNVVLYAATGTGYVYQWRLNSNNIIGATGSSYTASVGGNYDVNITKNSGTCPAWSAPVPVTVNTSLVAAITPGGPTHFCNGGNVKLFANTCFGYTYQWQKKDGNGVYQPISGATADAYTVTTAGWYQVRVSSGGSNQWSSGVEVTIDPTPAAAGSISGASTALPGQNGVAYYVPPINGATTYVWTLPTGATIASGANTNNITVNFASNASSGNITVAGSNGSCSGPSSSKFITVNCSPPATPTISSNGTVCQAQTITFSCTPAANYSWVGPDGWTSNVQNPTRTGAAVSMSGTYSLTTTSNGCTSAVARTTVIVENFASINPGSSTTFCSGSGSQVVLYASQGSGYTYQWRVGGSNISGATSNSYAANSGGSYDVQIAKNGGTCFAWSAPIQVTLNTGLTAVITPGGPTHICSGSSVVLFANTCSGYTYQWQKKDANGVYQPISGATSDAYTATTAGWYQVRVTSGGNNQWSSGVEVTIDPAPGAAGSISGPANVTKGQNGVAYSVPAITGATSYVWTLPSGASIATGNNTRSITVNFSSTASSGNISVAGYNGACLGTSSSKAITVGCVPPPTPTASSIGYVCQGQTITFTCTAASNYAWTGPDGWTSTLQNPTRTGAGVTMAGAYKRGV